MIRKVTIVLLHSPYTSSGISRPHTPVRPWSNYLRSPHPYHYSNRSVVANHLSIDPILPYAFTVAIANYVVNLEWQAPSQKNPWQACDCSSLSACVGYLVLCTSQLKDRCALLKEGSSTSRSLWNEENVPISISAYTAKRGRSMNQWLSSRLGPYISGHDL